ncbi:C-C motif chemokine 3-like [Megalobrama amblycephala]|uniref:C-C motif chemokine 3-like n=1 Tax=Megalobrama amblycephala TaxID=75352 RepID=UPI0020142EF2|nr:C-C motif chemokine 3-like [Megalobrama amblycephala]
MKNEIICSDPSDSWAIRVMTALTNRASTERSLEQHLRFKTSTAKDCCSTVMKNKPAFHEIVDYRVQETPLCSVAAVLFITVENNTICSSPTEEWVQDYIQDLSRRKTPEQTDKREFAINNFFNLKEQVENFCIKQP